MLLSLLLLCNLGPRDENRGSVLKSITKNAVSILDQGDRRHPDNALAVIDLDALTGVSFLMGRLSWFTHTFSWDGRHMYDVCYCWCKP